MEIIFNQVLILFILIFVGFICRKIKIINDAAAKTMTDLLFAVVVPSVIAVSFMRTQSATEQQGMLIAFGSAVLCHFIGMGLGSYIYRNNKEKSGTVLRATVMFTNSGFMGLPIIDAVLGTDFLVYGAVFVAVSNLMNWTYGVILYTGQKDVKMWKKALLTPSIVAIGLGLLMYFAQIFPPVPIKDAMTFLGKLNTPMSMVIIGNRIAQIAFKGLLRNRKLWGNAMLRLMVVPLILMGILLFVGVRGPLLVVCMIPASCPSAANNVLFAEKFGGDAPLASQLVTMTTLLSIITIPAIIFLTGIF